MGIVLRLILFSVIAVVFSAENTPHEKREWPLKNAINRQRVDADVLLPMRIGLQQNEHAAKNAESWIMAVADPQSPKYGDFWKQQDVIEAFQPSTETVEAVKNWLSLNGVEGVTHTDNKLWLAFDLPAHKAESIFETEYYEHQLPNGRSRVSCDSYFIPDELKQHIDLIKPGIKESDITGRSKRKLVKKDLGESTTTSSLRRRSFKNLNISLYDNPNDLSLCWRAEEPACLRALYNFSLPDPNLPVSPNNSLGIFESGDLYYQGDLNLFFTHWTNIPKGTKPIDLKIDGGQSPPNGSAKQHGERWSEVTGESDLDLQVAFPIVYPQNITVYQTDDFYWTNYTEYYVRTGFLDTFLDAIDGSFCTYSAFNQTGDSPIDPTYPDHHRFGYKGKLQCGVFKPPNASVPSSLIPDSAFHELVLSSSYDDFEKWLPVNYQKRQCQEWLKLGLQGLSALFDTGDEGAGYGWGYGDKFEIHQTVGCPWITSVGSTRIQWNHTVYQPEIGVYFSGGGFSNIFDVPAYQRKAVDHYFQVANVSYPYYFNGNYKNSTGIYNRNGRAVPDISANGDNYAIYQKTHLGNGGGTSMSTPLWASLINRIVEERIRVGKGPLGLINVALYQNPRLVTDIVSGYNLGTYNSTGLYPGWECAVGWDPVTGLGTPRYPELLEYFLSLP